MITDGDGLWNDSREAGHAQTGGFYPLCESITYTSDYTYNYIGCFMDDASRDLDGLNADGTAAPGASNGENGTPPPYFVSTQAISDCLRSIGLLLTDCL